MPFENTSKSNEKDARTQRRRLPEEQHRTSPFTGKLYLSGTPGTRIQILGERPFIGPADELAANRSTPGQPYFLAKSGHAPSDLRRPTAQDNECARCKFTRNHLSNIRIWEHHEKLVKPSWQADAQHWPDRRSQCRRISVDCPSYRRVGHKRHDIDTVAGKDRDMRMVLKQKGRSLCGRGLDDQVTADRI